MNHVVNLEFEHGEDPLVSGQLTRAEVDHAPVPEM